MLYKYHAEHFGRTPVPLAFFTADLRSLGNALLLQDGLRSLLLVATSLDDECQYNAAVIYRKLCADRHTHDYVVGRGGLQALLGLVQLRGLGTQRQAAAALRDVCSNKDHKVRFVAAFVFGI